MAARSRKNGISTPLRATGVVLAGVIILPCFIALVYLLAFFEVIPEEVPPLSPFILLLVPILPFLWIAALANRSYQQSYIPQLSPERLRKSKLLNNCYYSATLDNSRRKLETLETLYPPGSYFADSEGSRQKVLRSGVVQTRQRCNCRSERNTIRHP